MSELETGNDALHVGMLQGGGLQMLAVPAKLLMSIYTSSL